MNPPDTTQPDIPNPMLTPPDYDENAELLQAEFSSILQEQIGLHSPYASAIASAIVAGMRRRFGRTRLYIPAEDKNDRNDAIRRAFRGTNAAEVCRQHGISRSTLYKIVGNRG